MNKVRIAQGENLNFSANTARLRAGQYEITVQTRHPNGNVVAHHMNLQVMKPITRVKKSKKRRNKSKK